jgi:hypothetical protein
LNVKLDRNKKKYSEDAGSKEIKDIMRLNNLEDVRRRRNQTSKQQHFKTRRTRQITVKGKPLGKNTDRNIK